MKSLIFIFTLSFSINAYALKDCSSLPFWKEWNNCEGTLTFPSGEKYVGEFKDDKRNGQGTLTFPSGEKYVGEFKDDKRNGQGTLTFPSGQKYVGEFKDDKRNGQGTHTFPSGQKYVGGWKDSKRHGQGTYFPKDGEAIYGFFLEGDHIPRICGDMGFLEGTEAFGNCVFRLIDKIN